MAENHSEVARLLAQISAEYEAAERGLQGLASGTVRHHFINAKVERMSELHDSLRTLVGEQAIALIAKELEALPDATRQPGETQRNIGKKEEHMS
jgi:hypothetical protein